MNNIITVTQRMEFSCSYVMNHMLESKRYRVEATVGCSQDHVDETGGVVMDFAELKSYIRKSVPDKSFLVSEDDTLGVDSPYKRIASGLLSLKCDVRYYNMPICTETLCSAIAEEIQERLPDYAELLKVELYEDAFSYSTWTKPKKS